jgi:uncharacterized protein (DUF1501 family)
MKTQSNRRDFFKQLSLLSLFPLLKPSLLFASPNDIKSNSNPTLVFIFLRGAQDGLSVINPIGEENYYKWRPNIALSKKANETITIDNHFQLNPNLKPLFKFWNNKNLAFITEFGSPVATRSHFDAQDFIETGSPGLKNIDEGFLNRALSHLENSTNFSAMAIQDTMPRILKGKNPALSMSSLKDFKAPKSELSKNLTAGFEEMYQQATDKIFRGVGEETFSTLTELKNKTKSNKKLEYPKSKLANDLKDIATLINSDLGLSIAVTEMGGWDTHINQGPENGQFSKRLDEFSLALETFIQDIDAKFSNTLIVAMTEFGRTAKENGNKGTDHGHGSVGMVLGGRVNGGKLYGNWSGLQTEKLYEERDIPVTTDYRDLMTLILNKHLKMNNIQDLFPGFSPNENKVKNILQS